MLNADDLRRCECCEEPTKKVVGFWEGHDSYSGSPRAGAIYSCDNHECDICKEKMSEKESDELLKERVKVANLQNGTDAELLRRGRMSVRVALGAAADIMYRLRNIPQRKTAVCPLRGRNITISSCRFLKQSRQFQKESAAVNAGTIANLGIIRHREAATGRAAQLRSGSARRLASDGNHALTARSDFRRTNESLW